MNFSWSLYETGMGACAMTTFKYAANRQGLTARGQSDKAELKNH